MIDVRELMETPDGSDEVGTPNEQIAECNDCGTLHRRGSWHLCDGDRVEPDGNSGAVVADGGHDLPAGWVRVYDGVQKLQRRDGSLEIQMTDHCVGIDGDDVVRQGWQVDDPAAVGVRLAARLEASLPPADTGAERVLADGGTRVDPYPQEVIEAELEELERARAVAGPEPALRTDGGEDERDTQPIDVGDHVRDEEDPDATMLVVNLDTLRADAYELEDGLTVADVNTEYPADDDVVECVYPNRTDITLEDKKRFAYPKSRLEVVNRLHDRDGDDGRDGDEWTEDDHGNTVPERSEPADFGGGESTGVQDL